MRMRIGLALLVVVALTFLIAATTGRLSGTVTDRSGSVLPGVRVTVSVRSARPPSPIDTVVTGFWGCYLATTPSPPNCEDSTRRSPRWK